MNPDDLHVVEFPVHLMETGDGPRRVGADERMVRTLAQLTGRFRPVLAQRGTNRVIDGNHRLLAARMRGDRTIGVRFCDIDDADAFVLAVAANASHGLPLSPGDRKAAGRRVLAGHPDWSDQRVAAVVGLSDKTVTALRGREQAVPARTPGQSVRGGGESVGRDPLRCLQALVNDPALRSTESGRALSSFPQVRQQSEELLDAIPERDLVLFQRVALATSELWRMLAAQAALRAKEKAWSRLADAAPQVADPA